MSAYTIAIICPACGGNASMSEGARVVHCRFCDRKSLASHPLGYPALYALPKISEEDARLIAKNYVYLESDRSSPQRGAPQLPDKTGPPEYHQAFLFFIPFWRVQARLIGWVSGQAPFKQEVIQEVVGNGEGGGAVREKILRSGGEPLKRMLVHAQEATIPAVDAVEFGVLRYHWEDKTLKLMPFGREAQGRGYVLTPSISALKVQREAEANFLKRVVAPYKEYTDFFHRVKLLRTQLTLFYYPLWLIRGVFRGMDIRRIIDATDGQVVLADPLFPAVRRT